jgi:hypothetical protein
MAVCVLTVSGHGLADEPQPGHQPSVSAPAAPSDTQEQFNRLYRQFSDRFHEKMIRMAEDLTSAEIAAAAAALWHEVFAGRQDLLSRRSRELLAQLGGAPSIDESQYYEVLSKSFDAVEANPAPAPPHLVWSPIGAAAYYLDKTLSAVMCKSALETRAQLLANAQLTWEAIDRDLAKPRLVQRQGPVMFLVDLSRKDDGYRVDKIRWLRPKAMGPVAYYVRPDAGPPPAKPNGPLVGATPVADKKPPAPAASQ